MSQAIRERGGYQLMPGGTPSRPTTTFRARSPGHGAAGAAEFRLGDFLNGEPAPATRRSQGSGALEKTPA